MVASLPRTTHAAVFVGVLAALVCSSHAVAQGADDLYEITVKMEMAGMPMQMPAMTQRSCVKKGASDADSVPHQDNCRVTDARRAGNKLTFTMVCTGRDAMTGTGELVYAGDGYSGMIRYKGKMEGQDMDMAQSIAGRRVGACTAR
ncbi:MAG TPA: DUF3617 family protein [Casimicrobiaceae bacterium]|nr:DUF3617 family protein [Casimicrobiaceae bacterium]